VLDQQQLQTFVSIAQAGSIAAGARTEAISPSLASRRIAALEAVLGVRLFQRTTRKFKMTWPATQGPSLCVQLRGVSSIYLPRWVANQRTASRTKSTNARTFAAG
jgi:hypothetical protein